jgi:hypothetical protein
MNFRSLNLIWNWNRINRMDNRKWQCCIGLGPLWLSGQPSSDFPVPFGLSAQEPGQEKALGFVGRRWLTKFRRLPATRCNEEGLWSKLAGWRTRFGVVERRGGSSEGLARGGGRMLAWQSGGHRWGRNGRRGTPWRHELGVGARGSKNDQRRLALARSSWCSGGEVER